MAGVDFPEGITPFGPSFVPRRKEDEKKAGKGKGLFRAVLGKAVDEASSGASSAATTEGKVRSKEKKEKSEGNKVKGWNGKY